MKRISILGAPIDDVSKDEAVARIRSMLADGGQHHVMTPNPEMLVQAARDPRFLDVLRNASLNIPDGTGLLWATRRAGTPLQERVTGIDVLANLCEQDNGPVFLLGGWPGTAERAAAELLRRSPSLSIVGTHAGSPNPKDDTAIVAMVNASGARVLFVAYGSPKQDLWIARNLSRMPSVRVAMGVGGSFDFLAGVRSRAPQWMQRAGIEWLWRLAQEPRRIGRIINATVIFPWMVFCSPEEVRSGRSTRV